MDPLQVLDSFHVQFLLGFQSTNFFLSEPIIFLNFVFHPELLEAGGEAGTTLKDIYDTKKSILKGVFAKNERGYRLNAIKKRF